MSRSVSQKWLNSINIYEKSPTVLYTNVKPLHFSLQQTLVTMGYFGFNKITIPPIEQLTYVCYLDVLMYMFKCCITRLFIFLIHSVSSKINTASLLNQTQNNYIHLCMYGVMLLFEYDYIEVSPTFV